MDDFARVFLGTDAILKKEIKGINGWYYWVPGGKALIIDGSGHKLGATSKVSMKQHLEEFCRRYR